MSFTRVLLIIPLLASCSRLKSAQLKSAESETAPVAASVKTSKLLQRSQLVYQGAFKVPDGSFGGETFEAAGGALAYNPVRNSLYISSYHSRVGEITIPAAVNTKVLKEMNIAAVLQNFSDPTEGRIQEGAGLNGLMVFDGKLYGTSAVYYDASAAQRLTHYVRPLDLSVKGQVKGMVNVGDLGAKSGAVSGYMGHIPAEWQSRLGGPAFTGNFAIPIVTRTSWGPAAFIFDPHLIQNESVPAIPLLYYPDNSRSLGKFDEADPLFNASVEQAGMAVIAGSDSLLVFTGIGTGAFCYGVGTSVNPPPPPKTLPGGGTEHYCYDPESGDKGNHAYPYVYQFLAYDLNDLAAVKQGKKNPWELRPYAKWNDIELLPGDSGGQYGPSHRITASAYDAKTQTIYLVQRSADIGIKPVIHVFKVEL